MVGRRGFLVGLPGLAWLAKKALQGDARAVNAPLAQIPAATPPVLTVTTGTSGVAEGQWYSIEALSYSSHFTLSESEWRARVKGDGGKLDGQITDHGPSLFPEGWGG